MFVFIVLAVVLSVQAQVTLGPASFPLAGLNAINTQFDAIVIHRFDPAHAVPSNGFITAFNFYFSTFMASPGVTTASPPGDGWRVIPLVLRFGVGANVFTVVGVGPVTGAAIGTTVNVPVTPIAVLPGDMIAFYGTGGVPFVASPVADLMFYKGTNTPGSYACTAAVPAGPVSFTVGSTLSYGAAGAQFGQGCSSSFVGRTYSFNAIFSTTLGVTPTE